MLCMSISTLSDPILGPKYEAWMEVKRHETQYNDTQHIDIQHNETQHNDIQHNNKSNAANNIMAKCCMLSVINAVSHISP